jgi:hypothetical protein
MGLVFCGRQLSASKTGTVNKKKMFTAGGEGEQREVF